MPELFNTLNGKATQSPSANGHGKPVTAFTHDPDVSPENDNDYLRVVCALTTMADEAALFAAYPASRVGKVRLMARAQHLHDIEEVVQRYNANVLLIDHQLASGLDAGSTLVTLIQRLRHRPGSPVITFGVCYEPSWHKTFEEAGALGTIKGPITPLQIEELNATLPIALNKSLSERLQPDYLQKFSDGAIRLIDSGAWQRHVCTFWSTKGGVGKTFLATSFGVLLGVVCDRRTIIVDADMNAGDVHAYLGLSPRDRNIWRLAQIYSANGNTLSPAMVQHQMTPFNGNLSVICGAYDMALTGYEALRGEQEQKFATALLATLETMNYDFIIFDLGQSFFEPMHLVPLLRSTLNLVVVTSEKAAAMEMELALANLRQQKQLNLDDNRFRLILNKWNDRMGLDSRELVKRLGLPEFARVPYGDDMCVDVSLNMSKPLVLEKPNQVTDAIAGAVSGLYRPIQPLWERRGGHAKAKRASRLSSLFKREK